MPELTQNPMICIARIDFACGGNGTDETLTMTVGH